MSEIKKTMYYSKDTKTIAAPFCDFVLSCLRNEKPDCTFIVDSVFNETISFSPLPEFEKRMFVDIVYSNRIERLMTLIGSHRFSKHEVTIIGLWTQKQISILENVPQHIKILGKQFIVDMSKKYQILWWSFAVLFSRNSRIELSTDGKKANLKTNVLGFGKDYVVSIDLDKIDEIGIANKREFLRLIVKEKAKPALIVGNGVSIPFGSDNWSQTSSNLYDYLFPFYLSNPDKVKEIIGNTNYSITSLVKETLDKEAFSSALWHCIYRKYSKNKMHNETTLVRSIIKAKYRNQEMPIFTYNYDNFLETDSSLIYPDFKIKSVYDNKCFQTIGEPRIVHLHGFLDFEKTKRTMSDVIITDADYYKNYRSSSWIVRAQKQLLKEHICLFVGSSMSDLYQMSLIHEVRSKHLKTTNEIEYMWKCFALMCIKDLEDKDKLSIINYYLRKGVYLIFTDSFLKLPTILDEMLESIASSKKIVK